MTPSFIKGLKLSQLFYEEAVQPLLARHFPQLPYSAAALGSGSHVLGFDTPQSMDHDWGPKLMLFLRDSDYEGYREQIDHCLRHSLPPEIHGYPTNFGRHPDGTIVMRKKSEPPINHAVSFLTVRRFSQELLNLTPDKTLGVLDWLTIPSQILRSLVSGAVFHDGLGQLEPLRRKLAYYPHDIWLYLLATQWGRISQEEPFVGRCGQVGDDLGSRLVAARLVRDLMKLCFLIERQYAPYMKWFGSAFAQLNCASQLQPLFISVLNATTWQERQKYLTAAYEIVAQMHNDLAITPPLPTNVSPFHKRPFLVIHAERFADALLATISDEEVRALPANIGSIDQFVDSTDVLSYPPHFDKVKRMYEREA